MKRTYDDMLELPHHVSSVHPQMTMKERAAQFSPFAALTGYGDVIQETGRQTIPRLELSESSQEEIKRKLDWLAAHIGQHPQISVTYFLPDQRKEGGAYVTTTGRLKKIDQVERILVLMDGTNIPLEDVAALESDCFQGTTQAEYE